ncbi:MAG: GNAT family N-acetyltransferase [Sulfobacillus sp.]
MTIDTARLQLRTMTEHDVDDLLRIFSDPVAMQYYPRTRTRDEVKEWIFRTMEDYRRFGVGMWVIEDKTDKSFLGQCGIVPQEVHEGTVEYEIGYLLVSQFWGKGYATEAARACRNWGFEHLTVPHFISIINPRNSPSIRVAERNGMALREYAEWRDKTVAIYAITRSDWKALPLQQWS